MKELTKEEAEWLESILENGYDQSRCEDWDESYAQELVMEMGEFYQRLKERGVFDKESHFGPLVSTKTFICNEEEMFNGMRIKMVCLHSGVRNLVGQVRGYSRGNTSAEARLIGYIENSEIVPVSNSSLVFILRLEDGKWFDIHTSLNLEALKKVKFW